jgi:hypothetical protein
LYFGEVAEGKKCVVISGFWVVSVTQLGFSTDSVVPDKGPPPRARVVVLVHEPAWW